MDDPFESRAEREGYLLWALHAVSQTGPATVMQVSTHIQDSPATIDPVEAEKLREAVKQLEYEGLVFIDQDDRAHVADVD
ncbi:hypothetical protein [Haloglomus litoreum]|uniref:hypothetical protein n=1 Tax=Haloglomus litoreum TaxID=3034026 RepID=UPI0023E79A49|nr:hypothetical protein [Haloglomus sp. DT116]